ncbi:MAG TPA: hypothetical protein DCX41_03215 [Aequorivita sp.]|nr:hypothetical protein [Aequorivita sp.]
MLGYSHISILTKKNRYKHKFVAVSFLLYLPQNPATFVIQLLFLWIVSSHYPPALLGCWF